MYTSDSSDDKKPEIAIVSGANVLIASADGLLRAVGPDWKECPRMFSDRPCPRPGRDPMPEYFSPKNKKCQHCSYSAAMYCSSQEQALAIAKLIYPDGVVVE